MSEPGEIARRPRVRNARPKIERAALQLFVEEGVDATTTRGIAEQAGVSEGALYRHYKGKDELALALFMETHNRLGSMMAEAFEQGGSLEDRVRRVVTAYCSLANPTEPPPSPTRRGVRSSSSTTSFCPINPRRAPSAKTISG